MRANRRASFRAGIAPVGRLRRDLERADLNRILGTRANWSYLALVDVLYRVIRGWLLEKHSRSLVPTGHLTLPAKRLRVPCRADFSPLAATCYPDHVASLPSRLLRATQPTNLRSENPV